VVAADRLVEVVVGRRGELGHVGVADAPVEQAVDVRLAGQFCGVMVVRRQARCGRSIDASRFCRMWIRRCSGSAASRPVQVSSQSPSGSAHGEHLCGLVIRAAVSPARPG